MGWCTFGSKLNGRVRVFGKAVHTWPDLGRVRIFGRMLAIARKGSNFWRRFAKGSRIRHFGSQKSKMDHFRVRGFCTTNERGLQARGKGLDFWARLRKGSHFWAYLRQILRGLELSATSREGFAFLGIAGQTFERVRISEINAYAHMLLSSRCLQQGGRSRYHSRSVCVRSYCGWSEPWRRRADQCCRCCCGPNP